MIHRRLRPSDFAFDLGGVHDASGGQRANVDIMFDTDCERKLEAAAARLGVDLNSLTTSAGHA